jgi:hypothetical protein
MKCLHALSFVPVVLALASPALGQDAPSAPTTPRSYLIAVGGSSFDQNFDNPSVVVGGEYGERVHRDVFAYATLVYIENVMSSELRDYLETGSTPFGEVVSGRDRGLAFTMGAKFMLPTSRNIRPYFGAGFGFLNIKRKLSTPLLGDITDIFPVLTNVNDGIIEPGEVSTNKPLGELTVGINGAFSRRAFFDVRYRYGRVFQTEVNIDFSQITGGIGVTF